MKIEQHNSSNKGTFQALENGEKAGLLTYTWAGADKMIIDHTEVSPSFKGQGVGKELVMAVVNYARANNVSIIPLCPFAKSVFDKNTEIQDRLGK